MMKRFPTSAFLIASLLVCLMGCVAEEPAPPPPEPELPAPRCGNYLVEGGEECDGGPGCSWVCKVQHCLADVCGADCGPPHRLECFADLRACNLGGVDFQDSCLEGADLTGASLAGADLSEARLEHVRAVQLESCPDALPAGWRCLRAPRMGGFALVGAADLRGADLSESNLEGADVSGAWMKDLRAMELRGCPSRLPAGWVCAATGAGYTLVGPGADLRDSDLSGADLRGADLTGASLEGATLLGANVDGTRHEGCALESDVICPDGTPSSERDGVCVELADARCTADPQGVEWGPASVISRLALRSSSEESCCFDLDGDGQADNVYGDLMAELDFVGRFDATLAALVASGEEVTALELHAGKLSAWRGAFVGAVGAGGDIEIDPASIDRGAQSQYTFEEAIVADGRLSAGGGRVLLPIFGGFELEGRTLGIARVPVRAVRVEATYDADAAGYRLRDGKLGGAVRVADFYETINTFAATCDCLGLAGPLISVDARGHGHCAPQADGVACEADSRTDCAGIAGYCGILSIASAVADIDTDSDGVADAVSVGFGFDADGARLTGVTR